MIEIAMRNAKNNNSYNSNNKHPTCPLHNTTQKHRLELQLYIPFLAVSAQCLQHNWASDYCN